MVPTVQERAVLIAPIEERPVTAVSSGPFPTTASFRNTIVALTCIGNVASAAAGAITVSAPCARAGEVLYPALGTLFVNQVIGVVSHCDCLAPRFRVAWALVAFAGATSGIVLAIGSIVAPFFFGWFYGDACAS